MGDAKHSVRFPGESESYRNARNELLAAETELRKNIEAVAAKRRSLPLGGKPPEDYVFQEIGDDSAVRKNPSLRALFGGQGHADHLQLHVRSEDGAAIPELHVNS